MDAPRDNIVRQLFQSATITRDDDAGGDGNTLHGHFSVFNEWTHIRSAWEGEFLERIAPGAFADTFKERSDQIRVLYDHGKDPSVGNKPLGIPTVMEEDATGARYEVELFDTSYVADLKPALRAGQMGSSFRFAVNDETWVEKPERSDANPHALPERTVNKVTLYEFGPVPFPAYDSASAGLRSGSDNYVQHLLEDEELLAAHFKRIGHNAAARFVASLPGFSRSDIDSSSAGISTDDAQAALALARAKAALIRP